MSSPSSRRRFFRSIRDAACALGALISMGLFSRKSYAHFEEVGAARSDGKSGQAQASCRCSCSENDTLNGALASARNSERTT